MLKARQRYFVAEVDENGYEWKAGSQSGYATDDAAIAAAERLAKKTGKTHCVGLYEVVGEERDCIETIGYFGGPDEA